MNPERRYTHGGILAAIVDVAADYAIAAQLGRPVPTIDIRVDYHKAAMHGDLTAKAKIGRNGSQYANTEANGYDKEGAVGGGGRGPAGGPRRRARAQGGARRGPRHPPRRRSRGGGSPDSEWATSASRRYPYWAPRSPRSAGCPSRAACWRLWHRSRPHRTRTARRAPASDPAVGGSTPERPADPGLTPAPR